MLYSIEGEKAVPSRINYFSSEIFHGLLDRKIQIVSQMFNDFLIFQIGKISLSIFILNRFFWKIKHKWNM